MNKSKLKNRCTKWPSRENFQAFKKQNNIFKNLNKKTKKKVTLNRVMGKKQFWDAVKAFLTSKRFLRNEDIARHSNELAKGFN